MDHIRNDCDFDATVTRASTLFGGQKYVEVRSASGHSTLSFPVYENDYQVGDCVIVVMKVFEDDNESVLYTSIRRKPTEPAGRQWTREELTEISEAYRDQFRDLPEEECPF